MSNENVADGDVRRKGGLGQRIAYACGNLGQAAFYNAMSTYFVTYVTSCLFVSYSKALAAQMIAVITGLIVVIRIAEIFIDPLLGNLVDNTTTKWGRFRPWQFIGGLVSSVLIVLIFSGMFGLVNVNTTLFIVLFIITFIVLDVFYSLRDISYWGMIPALSSDSHERSTYTALGTFTGSIGYNGITVIVITHEMAVVEEICTHVAILDHGVLQESGTVEDIFSNPQTEAGRRLVYPNGVVIDQLPAANVIRIAFNGGSSYEPLIASLAIDCGVKVNILGADTRNIDGKAFGTMLLLLPDDPNEAAKALSYIRSQPNITAEEVEYHA